MSPEAEYNTSAFPVCNSEFKLGILTELSALRSSLSALRSSLSAVYRSALNRSSSTTMVTAFSMSAT